MGRRVVAWAVAAVVTVTLVGGGVLVARGRPDRSPAVLPALEPGPAGQSAADGASAAAEPAPAPGAGPARPNGIGGWPRVTYRRTGPLPALPDRARAWRLGDTPAAGRVAALAAALGLGGRPAEAPDGWTVRDGRRALVVYRLAGAPFTFGSDVLGACLARPGSRAGGGVQCLDPDAPVASRPSVPVKPLLPSDLPGRAEAERVARDLAARAGLDLAGARVRVTDGPAARSVTIDPAVGAAATSGFAWTVGVGAKGVVRYASGHLAVPAPAGTYPLIGVEEGFARLQQAAADRPLTPAVERDPCPAAGRLPCTRPLPARVATVTGVRLGLRLAPALPDGDRPAAVAFLLPAYLFDLEGGWSDVQAVVAVADRYLARP